MRISLNQVTKSLTDHNNRKVAVLGGISFTIEPNELVTVIGPSGCGKTTLLKVIAGLLHLDSGTVLIKPNPQAGSLPIVWQEHRLFPWRTVEENIRYGLELLHLPKAEQRNRTVYFTKLVGLEAFTSNYPHQLSGGMSQRVALARALAIKSEVLLMDEPFSSVDYQTRQRILKDLQAIRRELGITIVYVTHDIREAVNIATKIIVLSPRPCRVVKEWSKLVDDNRERLQLQKEIETLLL